MELRNILKVIEIWFDGFSVVGCFEKRKVGHCEKIGVIRGRSEQDDESQPIDSVALGKLRITVGCFEWAFAGCEVSVGERRRSSYSRQQ